ncbi:MAG: PRD domain-containing protein [Erysipelotrichaceae bacterium]|nr:PRD domain-containing protein [Erysipelotrichaceae bacterium]MDY4808638.1 PRD domain-containing protein [Bulleidia sp.]
MYKVRKVLNNNAVVVIDTDSMQESILIGTGIGFQKKTNMILDADLTKLTRYVQEKGVDVATRAAKNDAVYLEAASEIITLAASTFDQFDTGILLTLSDHIAFAVSRMNNGLVITNPFRNDIRLMFHEEYEVALKSVPIIEKYIGITINEDEVSYITLHLHSARSDLKIDQTLMLATLINESVHEIEDMLNIHIDENSLSYSRLLTHLKYLLLRCRIKEKLRIDMDEYTRNNFPVSYDIAHNIVHKMEKHLKLDIDPTETGYLAIHIERICSDA